MWADMKFWLAKELTGLLLVLGIFVVFGIVVLIAGAVDTARRWLRK